MKRLFAAALFLVIFLTYHQPARAQTLRVAGDENFPPYEFVDQDNVFKGFNVDLMKAIALFTEMELEFIPMPWEEAYEAIHNGQADIIQGMKVTDARKQRFAFTNTLVQNTDSIYIRAETTGIRSLKDLAGRRVGVDYGDVRNQDLENQGAIVVSYQNPEMALMALYRGEVDALVCNTLVINYFSAKHNISSEIAVVGKAFNRRTTPLPWQRQQRAAGTAQYRIKMVRDSGIYDQLYRKWFGYPLSTKQKALVLF
jgi:ABC-type amino acid transport substrate-binding protein